MNNIFTRMSFWTKFLLTVQTIGTFTQLSLIFGNSQHVYNVLVSIVQLAGLVVPIWMDDKNNNGIVDIFEKEVVTTIKSDSPITVETKTETPKP